MDTPDSDNSPSLSEQLKKLAENAWFAYITIILLQFKVMWGLWQYRDMTAGDTSSYYVQALRWAEDLRTNLVWSPLYTSVLGTLHRVMGDAFWVTMLAHFAFAITATVLVLAILRQLLPKPLAWFIAAWWAILPINFDTVYTVHLFSALFPLLIFAVLAYFRGVYGRGAALGLFILTTVLVRNEYSVATGLWFLFCVGYEIMRYRKGEGELPVRMLIAYGLPIFAACAVILIFYVRSYIQFPELIAHSKPKHTLNVCQIYAYNRQQQGDTWTGSPWTDCQQIMVRDFGVEMPTLMEAFRLNPGAILGHFWWNISLIPSGMQLALFNFYSGSTNPDYLPAQQSAAVWLPFILVIQGMALGLFHGWQKRDTWWKTHGQAYMPVWVAMLSIISVTIIVMVMQRPRPSYMFAFTFCCMTLFGLGVWLLFYRSSLARVSAIIAPIAMLAALLLIPPFYSTDYLSRGSIAGQPLRQIYQRMKPLLDSLPRGERITIVTRQLTGDACRYLHGDKCVPLVYGAITSNKPADIAFAPYFEGLDVDWIYFDPTILSQPATQLIRDELVAAGWDVAASGTDIEGAWMILASPNAPS
jgi:hypothetical protein